MRFSAAVSQDFKISRKLYGDLSSHIKWLSARNQSAINGLKNHHQSTTTQISTLNQINTIPVRQLDYTEELIALKEINSQSDNYITPHEDEIYQFEDLDLLEQNLPNSRLEEEDTLNTIFGTIIPSEEEIIPISPTVTASNQLLEKSLTETTAIMGISKDAQEIRSLVQPDALEYVKDELDMELDELNNGINTVELIFANTQAQQGAVSCVNNLQQQQQQQPREIYNQNLSNTDNTCLNQVINQQHDLLDVLHLNQTYQQIPATVETASTSTTSASTFSQQNQHQIFNLINNSPSTMYNDMEDYFFNISDQQLLMQDKDKIADDNNQDDELNTPAISINAFPPHFDMETEETFTYTYEDKEMILTSTQEMIIDNGISTEDLTAYIDTIYDKGASTSDEIIIDDFPHGGETCKDDIKLEVDPMLSIGLKTEPTLVESSDDPDSPIGQNDDNESIINVQIDGKAAEQLLGLLEYANSGRIDNTLSTVISTPVKKFKRIHPLSVNIPVPHSVQSNEPTTAQVVDTIFTWDNDSNDGIIDSTPPSASNSTAICQESSSTVFQFEDITQSSLISSIDDSHLDSSDIASTAPPTPYSCASYETTSNPERKRRGRPPKAQSTQPDPEKLKLLPPSKQKYILQRCKNNEASRQSRLNRKNKQDQLKEEAQMLIMINQRLKRKAAKLESAEETLKRMLQQDIDGRDRRRN